MPPQQSHGLLDLFDERFGFGAHGFSLPVVGIAQVGAKDSAGT
jgi:hypothetical protein